MGNNSIDQYYKILNILEENPDCSQRKIASKLGYSLGKVNYLISSLIEKKLPKLLKFMKSDNKLGYRYMLTPEGIKQKYRITKVFLKMKME
ncbi:MAG: MarR family EPS-associated transcriptional regulator [Spirochaetota bacterium]|nr:MAG: MarR family EPS-associated transcriptional regulator [Spirochaetota bacterium]